jgi:ABC-2 type transport system ATP-binding protein
MLINFFKELKEHEKVSIILTTHKMDLFQKICDDLIILEKGKIVKSISKEDFDEFEIESYF